MNHKIKLSCVVFLGSIIFSIGIHAEELDKTLRLGVLSLASPARIHQQWQEFAGYLAKKSGKKVEIVVPKGFKKIKKDVENKEVDIFYVNSHIFYRLSDSGKAKPLAQMMNLDGSINSRSVIFVRSDSGINSTKELKGKKIAFVSPMGAGGYVAPRAHLYHTGLKTKTEAKEEFTKNLSTSVHRVLLGDVDAGTMCGLNFKLMSKRIETGDLKVIETSDEYPENVLGIRSDISDSVQKKISRIIVGMADDQEGKKILKNMKGMKILKFVEYNKQSEEITRQLLKQGKF